MKKQIINYNNSPCVVLGIHNTHKYDQILENYINCDVYEIIYKNKIEFVILTTVKEYEKFCGLLHYYINDDNIEIYVGFYNAIYLHKSDVNLLMTLPKHVSDDDDWYLIGNYRKAIIDLIKIRKNASKL